MEYTPTVRKHLDNDMVIWLCTVSSTGVATPTAVWFLPDGDDLLIYSQRSARKLDNIERQPRIRLHFDSGRGGDDIVVLTGNAENEGERKASQQPGWLDKYEKRITEGLGMTVDYFDDTYSVQIRVRIDHVTSYLDSAPQA